jgi:hypothetical protein
VRLFLPLYASVNARKNCPRTHRYPPALTSIWCTIIGLLQNCTRGLGQDRVKGRKRVPNPPTACSGDAKGGGGSLEGFTLQWSMHPPPIHCQTILHIQFSNSCNREGAEGRSPQGYKRT